MKYRNLVMMVWLVGLLGCGTQQDLVSEAKIVVDEQPVIQKKEYSLGEVASHTTKIKLGIPVSVLGIDLGLEVERKFKSKTYTAAMEINQGPSFSRKTLWVHPNRVRENCEQVLGL